MVWVGGKGFVTSLSELPNVRTKATTHSVVFPSRLFSFLYLYHLYLYLLQYTTGKQRDVNWKLFHCVKDQPSSSHPPRKTFHISSVQEWNVKCASTSEADDTLYSTIGKQGCPNLSQDLNFCCSYFLCIFNICNLVGDRIQFYSLWTVSCVAVGLSLKSLQITTYRTEISNAVAYMPENQFLSFSVMSFSSAHIWGFFVNIYCISVWGCNTMCW